MKHFNAHTAFAPPAIVALCLCAVACGAGHEPASRTLSKPASVAPSQSLTGDYDGDDDNKRLSDGDNDDNTQPKDKDNDFEKLTRSYYDSDDSSVRGLAHAASATDRTAIVRLVERYFTAAAAGDGASACPMIIPSLANSLGETLGGAAGPRFARGKTCAEVATSVFAHYHRQIAADTARLKVSDVWVGSGVGVAMLDFTTLPGRQIRVVQTKDGWKMGILLDTELP